MIDGSLNLMILVAGSLYLYLNTRILTERFAIVTKRLTKLARSRKAIHPPQVDRNLQEFSILIDELHKCNFFWSHMMSYNYYIALAICCIELLVGE